MTKTAERRLTRALSLPFAAAAVLALGGFVNAGVLRPTAAGSYLLKVDSMRRWGCSRGGGSQHLRGRIRLGLKGSQATLVVKLDGRSTAYRRMWRIYHRKKKDAARPMRPLRPSFHHSRQHYDYTFSGPVTEKGGSLTLSLGGCTTPGPGHACKAAQRVVLTCRTSTIAVFPKRKPGTAAAVANNKAKPVASPMPVLRCKGSLPAPLYSLRIGADLVLVGNGGAALVIRGRYGFSRLFYRL